MAKKYIWVRNPVGRNVEIDETLWPELEKKGGYTKLDETPTQTDVTHAEALTSFQPSPDEADLNFVASFQVNDGMGRVGEEVLLALDRLGLKLHVEPLYIESEGLQERTMELISDTRWKKSKKTLIFSIPQVLPRFATEETYLHVPWDTTKAPDIWVQLMNQYCKKVYPVSHFTREVFLRSGVTVPMETIRHGVNKDKFYKLERNWGDTFTFTTFGNISTRKGTDILLKAFSKAFPKRVKDVELIIKSNKTMEWGKIEVPRDDRIKIVERPYSNIELLQLLKKTNCYVAPSRAEGFGLPPLEAMATGACVILHNATGLSMMANTRYNIPVTSVGPMDAPAWHYPAEYTQGGGIGKWITPDVKELTKQMKFVYQQRDVAKKLGDRAAKWTRASWDWDSTVTRMWKDITGVKAEKSWGDFYSGDTLTKNNVQDSVNSHKEFFWILKSFKANKIIETGCGTGEMAGWLTWKDQLIEGKKPTLHNPVKVIAVDIDQKVIKIAKTNLDAIGGQKVKLIKADAWIYDEPADLIFSQGLLEHFTDDELRKLIKHQLEQAPVLIHSVPNNDYGKKDFGNERLMSDEEWYRIFAGFDLSIYRYWDEDEKKKQSVLIFQRKDIKRPRVSIIMPVWNHKDMTITAIEHVRKFTKDYELIVLDNNSTDGIEKWLDEQHDIRTIHLSQNLGVPKSKNIGIACAKGEYICFLDNDTEVNQNWLTPMLKIFENKTVGFTGHEGYMVNKVGHTFLGDKFKTDVSPDWVPGSCFLFPKRLIKDVGLLLDRDLWCVEDVDYCTKIRATGLIGKLPEYPVNLIHKGSATASKFDFSVDRFNEHANYVWDKWRDFFNQQHEGIKIDIGVGDSPAPGYLHVDIQDKPHVEVIADTRKLPFESNTLAEVRNAHVIEHFTRMEIEDILDEWIRVLRIRGTLRVICPDFKKIASQLVSGTIGIEQALLWTYGGQLNKYDYHYWLYTPETLMDLFKKHGLVNVNWKYNADGWLEVVGEKIEATPEKKEKKEEEVKEELKVGVYVTHVHTYGGGENATFQVIKMLKTLYPTLEVISSEDWQIDPREFGIDLPKIKKANPTTKYDVFVNISHFELHEPMGKVNLAYVFYPQYDWREGLKKYQGIITISDFCATQIRRLWNREADVIFPATEVKEFSSKEEKENIVLSVGRFFKVKDGNNKNHDVMIEAFKTMPKNWKLILVGTVQDEEYYEHCKELASGYNVEFLHDIPFSQLTILYSRARFYWHAAGYKATNPSGTEHFGMVAVEAMASGCQPVVYADGGIAQIKGVMTWKEPSSLVLKTLTTPTYPDKLQKLAKRYSPKRIMEDWREVINKYLNNDRQDGS